MDLTTKHPLVIAHRGASGMVAHENTMEAFQNAINLKVSYIEFDVRRTMDGVLVCHHDPDIDGKVLSQVTYNDLQILAKSHQYQVPTVEEILILTKNKVKLDIELKEAGYEEDLIRLVKGYFSYDDFIMKSFKDGVIKKIKALDPKITTGLLLGVGTKPFHYRRLVEIFPLIRILLAKPDFVSPHFQLIRFAFIKRMKMLRKPVLVWVVNDEKWIEKLVLMGVDGIITDRPDVATREITRVQELARRI